MNGLSKDDIIRMAREAGAVIVYDAEVGLFGDAKVETFANLVAAAEREACAVVVEQVGIEGYGTLAAAAAIRARGSDAA